MQDQDQVATAEFKVVVNHEEQYSLLAAQNSNPSGWRDAGFVGSREACLEFINKIWTDMRPLSLRRSEQGVAGLSKPGARGRSAKANVVESADGVALRPAVGKRKTARKTATA